MPKPESTKEGGTLVGGAALYIMKQSAPEKQAAVWQYLKYLNEVEVQADWAAATGYIPTRQSAVDEPVLQARWKAQPGFEVAYDQLVTGVENAASAGPVLGAYKEVRNAVQASMTAMYTQDLAPDAALARAAEQGDAKIEEYNSRLGV